MDKCIITYAMYADLPPLTTSAMGVVGGRIQNSVGTSYLTENDDIQKDLQLSDT